MGALFSSPKPPPTAAVPPPPQLPQGDIQSAFEQQRRAAGALDTQTIATGPQGLTMPASTTSKSLLGA